MFTTNVSDEYSPLHEYSDGNGLPLAVQISFRTVFSMMLMPSLTNMFGEVVEVIVISSGGSVYNSHHSIVSTKIMQNLKIFVPSNWVERIKMLMLFDSARFL